MSGRLPGLILLAIGGSIAPPLLLLTILFLGSRRPLPNADALALGYVATCAALDVSVLFAGLFGPRGLASIALGLIVVAEAPLLGGRDEMGVVVALTVLLSVLVHGVTAAPLSAVYARRVQGMAADAQEKQGTVEAPTREGSVPLGMKRGG